MTSEHSHEHAPSFPTMEGGAVPAGMEWLDSLVPNLHGVEFNFLLYFQMATVKAMYHETFVMDMQREAAARFEQGKYVYAPNNHTMLLLVRCSKSTFIQFAKYFKEIVRIWGGDIETAHYMIAGSAKKL
jgi:hypothetical protein